MSKKIITIFIGIILACVLTPSVFAADATLFWDANTESEAPPDTTAPALVIASPQNNSVTNNAQAVITGTASGNSGNSGDTILNCV